MGISFLFPDLLKGKKNPDELSKMIPDLLRGKEGMKEEILPVGEFLQTRKRRKCLGQDDTLEIMYHL